jgi:putative oxidoreductase
MYRTLKRQGLVERAGSTAMEDVMERTLNRQEFLEPTDLRKRKKEPMTLSKLIDWMWTPPDSAPRSTILIRCMVGGVFLWEGILKFVYTNQGVGRFTKLGIPAPELMAHFIAVLEIVGGVLLISGFLTRLIAVPFVIEMVVAILSTKVALYFGTSPLPLPPAPPQVGAWAVLHEIRSDYAQIMSALFLLIAGPGPWSVDAILARVRKRGTLISTRAESAIEVGNRPAM